MHQTAPAKDPIVANLASFPTMSQAAEQIRARIRSYVEHMRQTKRPPSEIHLFGPQYDTLMKSANTCRRKIERDAPPLTGLAFEGIPVVRIEKWRAEP